MKRFLFLVLALAAALIYLATQPRRPAVAGALERAALGAPGTLVRLAELTDFPWDHVHVFGPYTPRADVEAALAQPWPGRFRSKVETSESVVLVVFLEQGRVRASFDLPRAEADLAPAAALAHRGLSRDAARFVVGPGRTLAPAPD